MPRLRYLTAGESHGAMLVGILDGMPARVPVLARDVDAQLARRQLGYGRGGRMRIEKDAARIVGGVRDGMTMGGPVALLIENLDAPNWLDDMSVEPGLQARRPLTVPRPGHADLAGHLKWGWTDDLRPVLERASARETAMRVALGAVARSLLRACGVEIASHVVAIGDIGAPDVATPRDAAAMLALRDRADASRVRCLHDASERAMIEAIDDARREKDSLGGVVEVLACGVPPGLGSTSQADAKLDGRLAAALMSLPAIKGVEIGAGFRSARRRGSQAHDLIARGERGGFARPTNHAGGLEGGMTNGEPLVLRAAMKPIATLMQPLPSTDIRTGDAADAHVERADTCAVPALGVIAEAAVALALCDALLECMGGDTVEEAVARVDARRKAGQ